MRYLLYVGVLFVGVAASVATVALWDNEPKQQETIIVITQDNGLPAATAAEFGPNDYEWEYLDK